MSDSVDAIDLLSEPPSGLPERLVAMAEEVAGAPAALYVVSIGGMHLFRVAGARALPESVPIISGVGPELGRDGLAELCSELDRLAPGCIVSPLWLRGRATAVLVACRGLEEDLDGLARAAAPAVELAAGFTDVFDRARRSQRPTAAAEIQQDLLGPRMAVVGGAEIAGSVLPAYDVGGDWFDHSENPECTFVGVADAVGRGASAAAISVVALGAIRAARRAGAPLEECCRDADLAINSLGGAAFTTAILAEWHALTRTFSWINCGHPRPLLLGADGAIEELVGDGTHPLGVWSGPERRFPRNERRLEVGDRVLIYTDGVTERRTDDGGLVGLEGLLEFLATLRDASAGATVVAIESYVRGVGDNKIADDATQLVMAVTG